MLMADPIDPLLPHLESLVLREQTQGNLPLSPYAIMACLEQRWGSLECEVDPGKWLLRKVEIAVGTCALTEMHNALIEKWADRGFALSVNIWN